VTCTSFHSVSVEPVRFRTLLEGGVRNGIYKQKEHHGRGHRIVNMGELFAHPRLGDVTMRRVELNDTESQRFELRVGDLLFARRSLTAEGAGKCSIVLDVPEPTTFESSIIRARVDRSKADSLFLYYWFNSSTGLEAVDGIRRQVSVAGITGTDLELLEILLPPLSDQRRIAEILGSLDDKIELNRRMNLTLEELARAVFKAWFVDFLPVRAKQDGAKSFPGMDADTFALFPDSFDDSPLGRIPKGWRVSTVGEEFDVTMGQSPPGSTYNEVGEGLPFFQGSADFGVRFPSNRVYCTAPTRFANPGDTLVSVRAPVGDTNMAMERCCIGRGVAAIRHRGGSCSLTYYTMDALRSAFDQFEGAGTVFGSINGGEMRALKVVAAPVPIHSVFDRMVAPLDELVESNIRESHTLAATRDLLLPRLLVNGTGEDAIGAIGG